MANFLGFTLSDPKIWTPNGHILQLFWTFLRYSCPECVHTHIIQEHQTFYPISLKQVGVRIVCSICSFKLPKGDNVSKMTIARLTCYAMEIRRSAVLPVLTVEAGAGVAVVYYVRRAKVTAILSQNVREIYYVMPG